MTPTNQSADGTTAQSRRQRSHSHYSHSLRRNTTSTQGTTKMLVAALVMTTCALHAPCSAWTAPSSMHARTAPNLQQHTQWNAQRQSALHVSIMGGDFDRSEMDSIKPHDRNNHNNSHENNHAESTAAAHSAAVDSTSAVANAKQQQQQQKRHEHSPKQNDGKDEEVSNEQKFINAVFLAASFGYAIFTILNIDDGMTRGWSASEIAMRIPLDNWGNYESCLANQPISTKTLINVIIYLLGDWLSQTAFAGNNLLNFDLSRTLRNGFIGLCFGPLVHEYYQFSDAILPPEDGLVTRLQKILMDQTLYLTVKCSMYISAVGLLSGDDLPTVKKNVQDKIGGIVITAWKFWPLVHCITYGLVPARHRILWVNSVDLVWNAILASKTQGEENEDGGDKIITAQDETNIAVHMEDATDATISIIDLQQDPALLGRNATAVAV